MYRDKWSIHRKTIAYFSSRESSSFKDPRLSSNSYIFGEDVRLRIMPYRLDENDSPYSIRIDPDNLENRKALSIIFSNDSHSRVADTVAEAIRKFAYRLAWWGKTHYEVATVEIETRKRRKEINKSVSPSKSKFFKPLFIPGKVIVIGNTVIQLTPNADRSRFGHSFKTIPKSAIWSLSIPHCLGGAKGLSNLQNTLIISSEHIPKSLQDSNWLKEKRFNWGEFNKQRKLLAAQGTAHWGWTSRGLWNKDLLEFYILYRELRFAWSLSILREYILSEMNKFLLDSGYSFKVEIIGFPSPKQVEDTIGQEWVAC